MVLYDFMNKKQNSLLPVDIQQIGHSFLDNSDFHEHGRMFPVVGIFGFHDHSQRSVQLPMKSKEQNDLFELRLSTFKHLGN